MLLISVGVGASALAVDGVALLALLLLLNHADFCCFDVVAVVFIATAVTGIVDLSVLLRFMSML